MKELFLDNKELFVVLFGFLVITISSNKIAHVFQKIHLPLITGMIFTGILCGPYLLNLIPLSAKTQLHFVNETALAFIAFAAGTELYVRELRSRIKSIKWNTISQLVITFFLGTGFVYLLADQIPYMVEMSAAAKVTVAMLTAAIFVARSPASAIAVVAELRAKGPFVQMALGVTVVADFLVIVLFSICLSLAQSFIFGTAFNVVSVLVLLVELSLSFVVGFYLYGLLLASLLSLKVRRLYKIVLVLLLGYSAYWGHDEIRHYSQEWFNLSFTLEPLLVCILASFYVTNRTKYRAEIIKLLHDAGLPVYVCFFTLTGASLAVDVLPDVIDIALIFLAIRIGTMVIGGYVGGFMAGDPVKFNRYGWMPYITQAGVALGLTTIVAREFPDWGESFSTVIIAVIILNQFIGPPLFKFAIFRLGEDNLKAQEPEFDGTRDALIFGFESQSIALAYELKKHGWNVEIATIKKMEKIDEPEDIPIHYIESFSQAEFEKMKAEKAEAIIAMLSDQQNLEICKKAYHDFGTRDLIVRLNARFNSKEFIEMGVKIVEPTTAIVHLLDQFVRSPQAASLLLGTEEGKDTRDIRIRNKDLQGLALRDLRLPPAVIILSIRRGGHSIISHGYTRLRLDDLVTMVGATDDLDEVQLRFSG
ncbi:MAG: potassium transporter TrkA [Cytophagales bacterium]|nr:potassium transporter TrkA [Cytophagales bacterium]